jgi:cytochrome c oxidase cbb3-type subunit III
LFLFLFAANICFAQQSVAPRSSRPKPQLNSANTEGQKIFASTCAGCHGLDGRGGERAPNIAQNREVQRLSDAQVTRIVEEGVPGTGMPAFHSLANSDVKAVVAYLRILQGTNKTSAMPGNPAHGKALFYGDADCSTCHMVAGNGGFIASDLSGYGGTHSVEEIRNAITQPGQTSDRQAQSAVVVVHGGQQYTGRIRNEDNFSLQLQSLDGTFHFFLKSDVERVEYKLLMPVDYASRLSARDLDDLASYLIGSAEKRNKTELAKDEE